MPYLESPFHAVSDEEVAFLGGAQDGHAQLRLAVHDAEHDPREVPRRRDALRVAVREERPHRRLHALLLRAVVGEDGRESEHQRVGLALEFPRFLRLVPRQLQRTRGLVVLPRPPGRGVEFLNAGVAKGGGRGR